MIPNPNELVQDPLFQLNVVLWLSQPLPETSDLRPLFHQQGFSVHAIAPPLPVPVDLRLAAQQAGIAVQDNARPDVVLARGRDGRFAFCECKAGSFGPNSSTAEQARAFLLMAGPRAAEVLGLTATQVKDQLLAYVTAYGQQVALTTTLGQLADALTGKQLPAGRFGVLALRPAEAELNLLVDSAGGEFFSLGQDSHVVMSLQPDTDARPLYFIPYDPDLGQAPQEKAFCKRVLFERIHSSVLVAVGRAAPPVELVLEIKGLLNDAMFGMYELWESRESARHMRALCRQLMRPLAQAINTVVSGAVTYDSDQGWKFRLPTAEQQKQVIDAVSRFSCETLNLRAEPERDLFEKP